jgi:signal transduction histidine kinase
VFNSDVLASRFAALAPERALEAVGDIKTSATRLRSTIECLLDYVRVGPPVAGELSIREIIKKTQSFLRPLLRAGGHKIVDLTDAEDDCVLGNRLAVEQIFLNLLLNALEAASGAVTVRVTSTRLDDRQRILVEDDGPGIQAEHCRQIFDPFFTTKPGGTGIGLSAAREAAHAAGGQLELVRSTGGAAFALTLPCRQRR